MGKYEIAEFPCAEYLIILVLALVASSSSSWAAEVRDLRCESRQDPLGVDVLKPRLSWKIISDRRGDRHLDVPRGTELPRQELRRFRVADDLLLGRVPLELAADDRGNVAQMARESASGGRLRPA